MKRILIVTGQSGSGKSSALQVLEDLGYYCIDNLPLALLPEIVAKLDQENNLEQLALGVDVRSTRADLQEFDHVFEQLQGHGSVDIIYLTTQDQQLISRFSASRRPHPLSSRFKSLNQCIQEEKSYCYRYNYVQQYILIPRIKVCMISSTLCCLNLDSPIS